jgi:hypothetical protein
MTPEGQTSGAAVYFSEHFALVENRPAALQRTIWEIHWIVQVEQMVREFAVADETERKRLAARSMPWGSPVASINTWRVHRSTFLKLVAIAAFNDEEAARLDLQVEEIMIAAYQAHEGIRLGTLDDAAYQKLQTWDQVLHRLAEIEVLTFTLLEARGQLPAKNSDDKPPDASGKVPVRDSDGNGGEPGESDSGERRTLAPCHDRALQQYFYAVHTSAGTDDDLGPQPTDTEAYEWLKEREDHEKVGSLPDQKTWARYLRRAREHHGLSKYGRRIGRATGRSVVRKDQV